MGCAQETIREDLARRPALTTMFGQRATPPTEARKLLLHDAQLWEQMADFEEKAYPRR